MNKLFKIKNFIIIEGIIVVFIFSSLAVGGSLVISGLPSLVQPLKDLLGNFFEICLDMGPTPESAGSGLPCFYKDIIKLDIVVLMPIVVIYFFAFIIYKLKK